MNKVRFMFLRNINQQPVGCVAIKFDRVKCRVEYQTSVLNPHDRFNRSVGRQLALGRLYEKPLQLKIGKEATMHDISKAVLNDIKLSKGLLPTRAVKAANLWLEFNDYDLPTYQKVDPFDSNEF